MIMILNKKLSIRQKKTLIICLFLFTLLANFFLLNKITQHSNHDQFIEIKYIKK